MLMLLILLTGTCSIASEFNGFYMGLQGGINDMEDTETQGVKGEMDNGFTIAGTVGYDFGYFRVEGEAAYRKNDIGEIIINDEKTQSSGDVTSTTFMLNGYFDFENKTKFTPFVGAGIGYNHVKNDGTARYGGSTTVTYDDTDTVLAYQLTAGVAWEVTDAFVLDLSYRYLSADDIEVAGTSNWGFTVEDKIDYENHSYQIGFRWYF